MPSGNDIAMHLLVDPPHRTFPKVGAAVYHGEHDIIVARTSRCARALPSVPFPTAALISSLSGRPTGAPHFRRLAPSQARACRSVFPSGFSPSFACTHPPTRSSVLLRSAVRWIFTRIYTLPWIRSSRRRYACVLSARVCARIRIEILLFLVILWRPIARPIYSTTRIPAESAHHPRAPLALVLLDTPLPTLNARPRARPEDLLLRALPPPRAPTSKPKPNSSVARPAPHPMGSVTVLPTMSPGESSRWQFCAGDIDTGRPRAFHLTATDSIDDRCKLP
ncbi:hypothetical protein B0H14DRAFT_528293 [Mycena olivaceomarginata]|nr:hypothetical protein B0H14DRAFT_528293 [Mycena olivaceomarginata]